ncbi:MAG: hypothetical protein ACLQVN_16585 [Bryobacteraceae bacterium]
MAALKTLVRIFSYLFHLVLTLFLLVVASLAMTSPTVFLRLDMLPWTGTALVHWVFFGSLFGLLSVLLAVAGKLRWLFLVWTLAVLVFLAKGYVFSGYRFTSGGAVLAACVVCGSLVAFGGACLQWSDRQERR